MLRSLSHRKRRGALLQSLKYWEIHRGQAERGGLVLGNDSGKRCAGPRALFIVDAHRDDGTRFVVRSDELLTAFLELEKAVTASR
jgi:hypothetical protein